MREGVKVRFRTEVFVELFREDSDVLLAVSALAILGNGDSIRSRKCNVDPFDSGPSDIL